MTTNEIIFSGLGAQILTFVASFAVMKYRLDRLEKDHEEGLHAVRIAKHSSIKEIKEDYRERAQVLHERIDRTRDENNKRFDSMNNQIVENNKELNTKIDEGFKNLNLRLDAFIQSMTKK